MSTQTLTYKQVQEKIKEAVVLRRAQLTSSTISEKINPYPEMTNSLGEQLYRLLSNKDDGFQDWRSLLWEYKNLMQQMLILIAKPGILALLPEHSQPDAADMLDNLIDFLDLIGHDDTHAFLDHERCAYIDGDEKELQSLLNYYDYDQRREHKYHSHYFGGLAREEEWERNAIAYKNRYFPDK